MFGESLSTTEELDLPTPIKEEMEDPASNAASPGNSPKTKKPKRSTSSSSLKADGPSDMRSSYWTYIHDQQKQIKKEHPDMTPKDVLKMAREKTLNSNNTSSRISEYQWSFQRYWNFVGIIPPSESKLEVDILHNKKHWPKFPIGLFQSKCYSHWPSTLWATQ